MNTNNRYTAMATTDEKLLSNNSQKKDLYLLSGISLSIFFYLMLSGIYSGYGYFIDELYYIACSKRLAFGYIDQPPLSIFVLAVNRWLLGDSLAAIRILPSLALSATAFITGLMARRLGGGRIAMAIAALAVIGAPAYLVMGSFYSMNSFEILIWATILYFVIRLVQEENPKHLLTIGILTGLGLEMKHTMILYAVALVIGMLLTPTRRLLWNRWTLWGMLGCFLLLLPNIIWQFVHGFPSLEFYRNAIIYKNIPTGPVKEILNQVIFVSPFALPVWIAGLAYSLFSPEGMKYRFLGLAYLVLMAVMIASQSSRPDRIAAIYTVLVALGGVAIRKLRLPVVRKSAVAVILVMLIGGGMVALPVATPLLAPPVLVKYLSAIGFKFNIERGKSAAIPQWIADRLSWRELAEDVGRVYHLLPPEEQRNTVIFTPSYGEAGAFELYGPEFGLPPVYSSHNSFHLWGPPPESTTTYITVLADRDGLEQRFASVSEAGLHTCEYCTGPQVRIPIYVARGPRFSVREIWPMIREYE